MANTNPLKTAVLGIQMLFVAFGALVLVPLLTGLDPSIALFTAGIGTLLFQLITGGSIPIFLASSFAFIAPIQYGMENFGAGATLGALACTGLVYALISAGIRFGGVSTIQRYLPPIVTGPVIMVIGLKLAPVAVRMARCFQASENMNGWAMIIATISLATAVAVSIFGKRMLRLLPILSGIIVGYVVAWICGFVDFTPIREAAWFEIPWRRALASGAFAMPHLNLTAIIYILPVAIAPAIEHVGDILAISSVTGNNYFEKPGLHRTLLGDGLATTVASILGGPPNTTYSEVTGAVALTGATDPRYMRVAAVAAILLAFIGKLAAVLKTIPTPVIGGIMVLLFGMIAAIGIGSMVRAQVDMSKPRNLVIASVILVVGIGDMVICCGRITLSGIGLSGIVGILLNIILPEETKQ